MGTKKKLASIPVDQAIYETMSDYAALYGISMPDLVARMWALWTTIDKARGTGLFPTSLQDTLQEPLGSFLHEMDVQAINLDEEYLNTQARNQAIAGYQSEHPFIEDSDEMAAICPSCLRETTSAGLIHLPDNVVKCSYCHTLPNLLVDYEAQFEKESEERSWNYSAESHSRI